MIKTDELRGEIAKNGFSQSDVAKMIGVTPKTFYEKMKNGVFGSDEIEIMIEKLNIKDPMAIFFYKEVTYKDTKKEAKCRNCRFLKTKSSEKSGQ